MTESSETEGVEASGRRLRTMRSSTTRVSRSTWVMAMSASSRTTSGSSVAAISSSRMSSAVRGVRSWWDASDAKSRSAASDRCSPTALRERTSLTRSTSAMPESSGSMSDSPAPRRSARWASSVSGVARARA